MNEYKKKILKVIQSHLGAIDINEDSDLVTLGVDSLLFIRIIVGIENEFNIEISEEQLRFENFYSINTIYETIKPLL